MMVACVAVCAAPKPSYYHTLHDGPVATLQRSPFLKEVVLTIGGWTWAIWKEGISVSAARHSVGVGGGGGGMCVYVNVLTGFVRSLKVFDSL